MSCKNFETVIIDLARNRMLEAGARDKTLAHMEACKHCAARLADEQTLTAGLHAVALNMETAEPHARVEAALVAAFRTRSAAPPAPDARPVRANAHRWLPWSVAAAAAVLVAALLSITGLLFTDSSQKAGSATAGARPSPVSSPAEVVVPERNVDPVQVGDGGGQDADVTQPVRQGPSHQRPAMQYASLSGKKGLGQRGAMRGAGAYEEITTEYVPLTYGGLMQVDDSQVVRVELPRSALQSYGIPVNAEFAGERVKADVLLGHDGVARAIRLVK